MITAFHIPDFQAWYRARYTQKPTIIIKQDRIVAATADLREAGVLNGDLANGVCRRFPHTVVHLDDQGYERGARELIMSELFRASDSVEVMHEVFLCVEVPTQRLAEKIGEWLGCRVGWASDDRTACFASLVGPSDRLTIVREEDRETFIGSLPSSTLLHFGFGRDVMDRFRLFGNGTIDSLRGLTLTSMRERYGASGLRLYELLHSEPRTTLPSWTPPPTVELSYRFNAPVQEVEDWSPILTRLCRQGVGMLNGMKATYAKVVLEETDQEKPIRYTIPLKHPSADSRLIGSRTQWIIQRRPLPTFGRMTIMLGGLVQQDSLQYDLFETRNGLDKARRAVLRRFPNGQLHFEEIETNPTIPDTRWRYATAGS